MLPLQLSLEELKLLSLRGAFIEIVARARNWKSMAYYEVLLNLW